MNDDTVECVYKVLDWVLAIRDGMVGAVLELRLMSVVKKLSTSLENEQDIGVQLKVERGQLASQSCALDFLGAQSSRRM